MYAGGYFFRGHSVKLVRSKIPSPPLPLEVGPLEVGPLKPGRGSGEAL